MPLNPVIHDVFSSSASPKWTGCRFQRVKVKCYQWKKNTTLKWEAGTIEKIQSLHFFRKQNYYETCCGNNHME